MELFGLRLYILYQLRLYILSWGAVPLMEQKFILKEQKKPLLFYCKNTNIHIVYNQIYSICVILKFH